MLTIGIDPDLHDTAIAWWGDGGPEMAEVVHFPKKTASQQSKVLQMVGGIYRRLHDNGIWRADKIAVEAQTLQREGIRQHKRPQDIVVLGNVAGGILGCLVDTNSLDEILFPTPEEWKGQIPKKVMQARLYDELGWGYQMQADYALPFKRPESFKNVTNAQWKHVGDAILLARWARSQK